MSRPLHLLIFKLDEQLYALRLSTVERVVRAAAVTPLPRQPEIVLGAVSIHGRVVALVNIRRRFGLPERDMQLTDQMVIARTLRRTLALLVDATVGVVELSQADVTASDEIVPNLGYVDGVARMEDGIILIHDLDRFLSLDEENALDSAVRHEMEREGSEV